MRELGKSRTEVGGALTLLFTSTMLSGLRAGVLCCLAMAGPGGPGTVSQATRQDAGAQPGRPARAAPPLAVAFAPPSHPDHDVKRAATESRTLNPRFQGNGDRGGDVPACSYVITLLSARSWSLRHRLRQIERRGREVTFIECCVPLFPLALTRHIFLDKLSRTKYLLNPSGSHGVEVAPSQLARTTVGAVSGLRFHPLHPSQSWAPSCPVRIAQTLEKNARITTSRRAPSLPNWRLHTLPPAGRACAHALARTRAGPRLQATFCRALPLPRRGGIAATTGN